MFTTWKTELASLLKKHWRVGQSFTLQQVYDYEEQTKHFSRLYPRNRHIRDSIRRTLQELRDEYKMVEFLNNDGTYKRIA